VKNKKKFVRNRPIDIANKILKRQMFWSVLSLILPPLLITMVLSTLFYFQGQWYPPIVNADGTMTDGVWWIDPFTWVIIAVFITAQVFAFVQFVTDLRTTKKTKSLVSSIAMGVELDSLDDLKTLAQTIREKVPHSDVRSMVLNWIDYRGESTVKRNDVLENNSYVRMDLNKESTTYFHTLMNRITLKLGFFGTLLGLMKTFPKMKAAILSLEGSGGEMTFVKDIAAAIDGDQYAILTTLIATILSLLAEMFTILLINRAAVKKEMVMSYLTDWYHTRVEPLYTVGTAEDSLVKMESTFSRAEEILAQNMQVLTTIAEKNSVQLNNLADFGENIEKRVGELESYEKHYRDLIETKNKAEEHLAGNIRVLTEVADKTGDQLKGLVSSQEVIGARVENLQRYEEQYRSLIGAKDKASVPTEMRPNKGVK